MVDSSSIHCGYAAQKKVAQSSGRTEKKRAYNDAMRQFQDRYYQEVGLPNAQLRFGPRRTRMSRSEWMASKKHAELLSKYINGFKQENLTLKLKLSELIKTLKTTFNYDEEITKTQTKSEKNYE